MSKRYEDPISVEAPEGSIEAFWWRGRRYLVRQVLCRWREAGGWWEANGDSRKPWAAGDAREILRVDAVATASRGPGGSRSGAVAPRSNGSAPGTYEIARDLRKGEWSLFRVWD